MVACLVETFYGDILIADYYSNTAGFAANCVNKNKPKMHCNGKCQLQKKMNEANNNDKQQTTRKNAADANTLSSKTSFEFIACPPNVANKQEFVIINEGAPVDIAASFFHPPCIIHV